MSKPVRLRDPALQDVDDAISYYNDVAGGAVARAFYQRFADSLRHIAQFPASGMNRYAAELCLSGLKVWPIKRFPYLLFYQDAAQAVIVLRMLQAGRDIPRWFL